MNKVQFQALMLLLCLIAYGIGKQTIQLIIFIVVAIIFAITYFYQDDDSR